MTDWLMVIITTVYVIATIFICVYNGKSAHAAKKQTDEMIRQYQENNRPKVIVYFDIIRSGLMCFIIKNEGNMSAENLNIKFNSAFIDQLDSEQEKDRLLKFANSNIFLASGQTMYVLLGSQTNFSKITKETAEIDLSYNNYNEHTTIDISQYGTFLVYSSPLEDMSQRIKKMQENEQKFQRDLLKQVSKHYPIQNVVIHSETQEEADKFKIYKSVCCEPRITANNIAEKLSLDKEYVFALLIELQQVDRLVSCFPDENEDDYKAQWYTR